MVTDPPDTIEKCIAFAARMVVMPLLSSVGRKSKTILERMTRNRGKRALKGWIGSNRMSSGIGNASDNFTGGDNNYWGPLQILALAGPGRKCTPS